MSEHLYRDEVGAAVERLTQLEEENARLRAELDALVAPQKAAAQARFTAVGMVLLAGLLSAAGVGMRAGCPHEATSKHTHFVGSQRTASAFDARARAARHAGTEFHEIRGGDDCATPYYYDSNGVRQYRTACLRR